MSEGHSAAYDSVCASQSNDELVLDMLQYSATFMAHKQMNMSADMILEDAKREFESKPSDNIACERWFGFVDWRKRFAQCENILRTDCILCWKLNDVSEWLSQKSPEEQDRLVKLVNSVKFHNKMLDRQKVRTAAAAQAAKERAEKMEKKGRQRFDQTAAILNMADMWEEVEIDDRIAVIEKAPDKIAAMKAQWKHCKEWYKKANIKFPYSSQPNVGGVHAWIEGLKLLLNLTTTTKVREVREERKDSVNETKSVVQEVEESGAAKYKAVDPETLQAWCKEQMDKADKDVNRSRLHRGYEKNKEKANANQLQAVNVIHNASHNGDENRVVNAQNNAVDNGAAEDDVVEVEDGDTEIEMLFNWGEAAEM